MEQKIIVTCPSQFKNIYNHPLVTHEYIKDMKYMMRVMSKKPKFVHIQSITDLEEVWYRGGNSSLFQYFISPTVIHDRVKVIEKLTRNGCANGILLIKLYQSIPDLPLNLFLCNTSPMNIFLLSNKYTEENKGEWYPLFIKEVNKRGDFQEWHLYYSALPQMALKDFKKHFVNWVNNKGPCREEMFEMLTHATVNQTPLLYWVLKNKRYNSQSEFPFDEWMQRLPEKSREVAAQCVILESVLGPCGTISQHDWVTHYHRMKKRVEPSYEESLIL